MLYFIPNKKTEHLTQEQLKDFVQQYYDFQNLKEITAKFNLGNYYQGLLPRISIKGHDRLLYHCPCCAEGVIEYCLVGRSGIKEKLDFSLENLSLFVVEAGCASCGHNTKDSCICEKCCRLRNFREGEDENKKKKIIHNEFAIEHKKYKIQEIPLEVLVQLYAFCFPYLESTSYQVNEEPLKIHADYKITPNQYLSTLVEDLLKFGIISISPESPVDSFSFENDKIVAIKLLQTLFKVNLLDLKELLDLPKIVLEHEEVYGVAWSGIYPRLFELRQQVEVQECFEYLENQAKLIRVNCVLTDKIKTVISAMLTHFEVEQCYSLIFTATKNTIYKMHTENMNIRHLFHWWICNLEKTYEQALNDNWSVKSFDRPMCCQKSILKNILEGVFH